jgi:hypothetical protein
MTVRPSDPRWKLSYKTAARYNLRTPLPDPPGIGGPPDDSYDDPFYGGSALDDGLDDIDAGLEKVLVKNIKTNFKNSIEYGNFEAGFGGTVLSVHGSYTWHNRPRYGKLQLSPDSSAKVGQVEAHIKAIIQTQTEDLNLGKFKTDLRESIDESITIDFNESQENPGKLSSKHTLITLRPIHQGLEVDAKATYDVTIYAPDRETLIRDRPEPDYEGFQL